jgi:hypothetical protein
VKNAHNRGWWYSLLLVVSRPWSVVRGWPFRENGKKRDERSHCGRREDGGRENAPNEPTTIQESVTNEPKLVRHRLPGARRGNEPSDRTGHRSQVACGKQDQSMKHFCETNPLRPATSRRTNPRSVRCPLSVVRCPRFDVQIARSSVESVSYPTVTTGTRGALTKRTSSA